MTKRSASQLRLTACPSWVCRRCDRESEVRMLLDKKIAIITGGGRGIGRAIALRFASEGAAVLIAARTESELKNVVAEIQQSGGRAAHVVANVSRETDCSQIIEHAGDIFGRVDILVNNAGD